MMDIIRSINWTIVLSSAATAAIVGGSQMVFNRYLSRFLDRIEKEIARSNKNKNGGSKNGNSKNGNGNTINL